MKFRSSLFRVLAVLLFGVAAHVAPAQSFYLVSKQQGFVQTSAAGSVVDTSAAFGFRAEAGSVVTLTSPGGGTAVLPSTRDGEYGLEMNFSTKAALDAAYPAGTYQMTGTGLPTLSFNLTNDVYPSAPPQVVGGTWNSGGLLVLNPAVANTINFNTFAEYATAGATGHMSINVNAYTPGAGNLELQDEIATQAVFGITQRATPVTSFTIPAGTLISGQAYRVDVDFDRLTTLDTTSVSGGGVVAIMSKKLVFYVAAQAPGTSTTAPTVNNQAVSRQGPAGSSVTFGATVTTVGSQIDFNATRVEWRFNGGQLDNNTKYAYSGGPNYQTLTVNNVTAADAGTYTVVAINAGGIATGAPGTFSIGAATAPAFAIQPAPIAVTAGGNAQINAVASGATSYQWQRNGTAVAGGTNASLAVSGATTTGLYTVVATGPGGSTVSLPTIVVVSSTARTEGAVTEVGSNILHPVTGNTYDQFLLTGASATVTADAGQVTRISFIDLNDDIVQVEFSGAGRLNLSLENPSGPAEPVKYNQAVSYMKGHATIILTGGNETTNLSVFSVGRGNAVNQALFKEVSYDSHADIAVVALTSLNGQFGGVRTANASYFNTKGITGVFAPGIQFQGPVFVGDINGSDNAKAVFIMGSSSDIRVTGGDLFQSNGGPIAVRGITQLKFTAGTNSKGELEAAQTNQGRLEQNDVDVTAQLVTYPTP